MGFNRITSALLAALVLQVGSGVRAQTVLLDARSAIDTRRAAAKDLGDGARATIESHAKNQNIELALIVQIDQKALDEKQLVITVANGVSQTFERIPVKAEHFPSMKVWHGVGGPKDRPFSQDQARLYSHNGEISGEFTIGRRAFQLVGIGAGRALLSEYGEKLRQPAPHHMPQPNLLPRGGSLPVPELVPKAASSGEPTASAARARPLVPAKNEGVLATLQNLPAADRTDGKSAQLFENLGSLQVPAPRKPTALPAAATTNYPDGINLLFAVTANALSARNNSTQFIPQVVGEMNQIMSNNGVAARFNLVGIETFPDYQAIGFAYGRVANNFDVIRARNHGNADLIIVFGVYSEGCMGLSAVYPAASEAYSVISAQCQNLARATVHEIGHLMGGRHNTERDGELAPFAAGHGHIAKVHYFPSPNGGPSVECIRTIMADQAPASGCGNHVWTTMWSDPSYKAGDLHKQQPPNGWWGPYQSVYLGNGHTSNMKAVLHAALPRTRSLRTEKLPESRFEAILMLMAGLFD